MPTLPAPFCSVSRENSTTCLHLAGLCCPSPFLQLWNSFSSQCLEPYGSYWCQWRKERAFWCAAGELQSFQSEMSSAGPSFLCVVVLWETVRNGCCIVLAQIDKIQPGNTRQLWASFFREQIGHGWPNSYWAKECKRGGNFFLHWDKMSGSLDVPSLPSKWINTLCAWVKKKESRALVASENLLTRWA